MWDYLGPPQSTTDFASYFPLFYQSQPLRPVFSTNTILIAENSTHYPLANLAKPSQCPQFSRNVVYTSRRLETKRNKNLFRLQNSRKTWKFTKTEPQSQRVGNRYYYWHHKRKMQRGREAKKQGWHTQYKWAQPSRPQSNRRNPKIRDQTDRTATPKAKKPKEKGADPEEETPTSTRVERKKVYWRSSPT